MVGLGDKRNRTSWVRRNRFWETGGWCGTGGKVWSRQVLSSTCILRWKYTRGYSCFLPRKQMKSFPVVVRNDSAGLTVCTPAMRNQNWSTGLELEVVET